MHGTILHAQYYPEHGYISLNLAMNDGSKRRTFLHKSLFTFQGKPFQAVPGEEVDREMTKTAELFQKARGRKVLVSMDESQARLEW